MRSDDNKKLPKGNRKVAELYHLWIKKRVAGNSLKGIESKAATVTPPGLFQEKLPKGNRK